MLPYVNHERSNMLPGQEIYTAITVRSAGTTAIINVSPVRVLAVDITSERGLSTCDTPGEPQGRSWSREATSVPGQARSFSRRNGETLIEPLGSLHTTRALPDGLR